MPNELEMLVSLLEGVREDNKRIAARLDHLEQTRRQEQADMRQVVEVMKNLMARMIAAQDETAAARRHGELDDWTKDLSTKLTILQSTVDDLVQATARKRGFFG